MKKIIFGILVLNSLIGQHSAAQSSSSTLDVVSWNIEWYGSSTNGPSNDDLQETNVKKIFRFLDADLYGIVEVVDTMRFRRLVDSLGANEYGYIISPYCTQATSPSGNAWLNGQKMAFVYRKSVFSNISTRGLMRNSTTANSNWASGRFPFMFSATATVNGVSKNLNFIVIHAKSGDTQSDYLKRLGGAQELKDTLDAYLSTTSNYIIGDFNDALNTSIYTGSSISSFDPIVKDSIDSDHYKSVTLPLGAAGQSSMINYPNVIDNHVISNEVGTYYIPGSARIRTDVTTVVPDYVTAHNTSDHYPVFSNYSLSGVVTSVPVVTASEFGIKIYPNPVINAVYVSAEKSLSSVNLSLYNIQGQQIWKQYINRIASGTVFTPSLPLLAPGIYLMRFETNEMKSVIKLTVL